MRTRSFWRRTERGAIRLAFTPAMMAYLSLFKMKPEPTEWLSTSEHDQVSDMISKRSPRDLASLLRLFRKYSIVSII